MMKGKKHLSNIEIAWISAVPYLLITIGIGLAVINDTYFNRIYKRIFILIAVLTITLIIQNVAEYLLNDAPYTLIRKLIGIYGYSVRPVIIVLFYYFADPGKKVIPAWCLAGLNGALYLTALFSPLTFSLAQGRYFKRGPLGYSCHVVGTVLLVFLIIVSFLKYRKRIKEMILPVICILLIFAGVMIDGFLPTYKSFALSFLTVFIVISCIFIYVWLHIQFVRQHESDLMAEQRIKIMLSQIQPHFLFNTIATFRALCKKDPDKAAEVAEKFGQYLRRNLNSLTSERLISFEKEMEHTKTYADIEMVRFENIRVEYDLKDTGFYLPPLTVQPIVENAIRHGVRIRKEGVVAVSSVYSGNGHKIIIRDNGSGFDVSKTVNSDGEHIGLKNVCERVEKLCGGTVTVESKTDEGTTVTIYIPDTAVKK